MTPSFRLPIIEPTASNIAALESLKNKSDPTKTALILFYSELKGLKISYLNADEILATVSLILPNTPI